MTEAVVAGLALIAFAVTWAALRHWTRIYLWLHDAVEVSAEGAPTAYAALAELARAIDVPRPRLYVLRGANTIAVAFRQSGQHGVALAETALERLSAQEVWGTMALLVALLASPGAWQRQRQPADWFATDDLATTMADRRSVAAALLALALTQGDASTDRRVGASAVVARTLAKLNRNVVGLLPSDPPLIARIAQLHVPSTEAPREA